MEAIAADVWILTEPGLGYVGGAGSVVSPPLRASADGQRESWVALTGAAVEPVDLEVPFERTAIAAKAVIVGRTLLLYGSVLLWLAIRSHAPDLVQEGESAMEAFQRVLVEQARDVAALQGTHGGPVIWAGDFNQSLHGSLAGGSNERRTLLRSTLAALGLVAWNGEAAHACEGACAVDLLCGPASLTVTRSERIDPVSDGIRMSEHAGYWVDLT